MRTSLPRMRNEGGVSEVVGTILILAMTVVLFASIILWVSAIPTPQSTIRIDMDGQLDPIYDNNGFWAGANFTARHRGGESLLGWRTNVYFTVLSGGQYTTEILNTEGSTSLGPYGIDGPNEHWDAGETWSYTNYSILEEDRVTLAVVDSASSVIVWMEEVLGPTGAHPPVFLEKWLDGDISTAITRDTPLTNQPFGLYVRVEDPDGDLRRDNVSARFTFGPLITVLLYDDMTHGDRVANDGVFTRYDLSNDFLPKLNWDGRIIILKAEDTSGVRKTESRLIFRVIKNPDDESQSGGGSGSGPFDLFHSNEFQAYAIYNSTEWDGKTWAANETRVFKKSDEVVLIVASQYLRNLDLQNDVMVYNPDVVPQTPIVYSNPPYNRPVTATTKPSTTAAFDFLEFTSDFYIYIYRFNTDSFTYGNDGVQLDYGQYHLEITLRASNVPPPRNQFNTVEAITVTAANGTAPDYPFVEFFKNAAHTQPSDEFVFTDTMYVRVKVLDTDAPSVSAGDVVISDFVGGVQVWARPGTVPVSTISVSGPRYYAFSVDLSNPNRDPWVLGTNSYGFRIKVLADNNEDYTLSEQVVIRGPRWSLDVASAIEEFAHPVFGSKWYSVFNDNDRLWSTYLIQSYQPFPGFPDPPWGAGPFLSNVLVDLDDDGDLDTAVGTQVGHVFWYRNTGGRGHSWERFTVDIPASPVGQGRAIAAGKIDQDLDSDLVVGTHNGNVYWYRNDGVWTRSTIASLGASVVVEDVKVGDVDMDLDKDVVVGTQESPVGNSRVIIYKNNGGGASWTTQTISPGGAVYDLSIADTDNDTDNEIVIAAGSSVRIYRGTAFTGFSSVTCTSPALCLSVDVGNIDADALLDLAAGTDNGDVFWWRQTSPNIWGPRNTILDLPVTDDILTLRVGDIDGDFLDDVMIGTATGAIRWLRRLTTGGWDNRAVLSITSKIYELDIGDVDRGVLIERSR